MKKLVLLTGILLLAFTSFVGAQPFNWTYVEDFVTDLDAPHGVAVDPNGNIWVQPYYAHDTVRTSPDTLAVCALHVYDAGGSQIAMYWNGDIPGFGPDTFAYTGRGINKDNNGNILVSNGYQYRINYQTGAFMNRFDWKNDFWSLTEQCADENGFIYCTRVVPGGDAIWILDANFQQYNIAVDSNFVISRTLEVSADGKDLYLGGIYPAAGAIHYHSDFGPDGQYTVVDTLLGPDPTKELWGQILDWGPRGNLYIGSYWDVTGPAYKGWYAIDPATNNVFQDSIGKNITEIDTGYVLGDIPPGAAFAAPRGVAFWEENDGSTTAYTADFDGNVVKKWTNPGITGVIVVNNGEALLREFELRQNFPNPFNPATKIPFRLRNSAYVKLVIYNVNGQVVKTLVNEKLSAGSYEYDFNASEMASGTYFYRITVDGNTLTKRMMLLK
jgi:Secretion system C-terminal sorting domain